MFLKGDVLADRREEIRLPCHSEVQIKKEETG